MQQYIDFYRNQRSAIQKLSTRVLDRYRDQAFEVFQKKGFPVFGSEAYQHTDIPSLLAPDYGFNLAYLNPCIDPYTLFKCNIPNLSTHMHFVINDRFYQDNRALSHLPEAVFSGSLVDFAEIHPDVFRRYYGQLALPEEGISAFNTMFAQDGYVLYVPKNTILNNPIQITNVLCGKVNSLINRRFLFILEAGAQAKVLVCDHTADEGVQLVVTQVMEIFVGENATFDLCELEESSPDTVRLATSIVQQEKNSRSTVHNITLSNGTTRNDYTISLRGEMAETQLCSLAINDEQQRIDNYTRIEHHSPRGRSHQLFKYILDNQAMGSFSGKIYVAPGAQKTQAYQSNRNLCSGNECRMFSKPQLEIYADDVKCTHGLTTGQLDDNALFYMRSRGISEAEARFLLQSAFTADIIDGIHIEGLRERLKMLIDKRFRGELVKCRGCI